MATSTRPPETDAESSGRPSEPPSSLGPLRWAKPPQQARSQKTLERMLDAAELLIMERGVAGLTVSEVVRRAGSSVGAFYARFPDKDALLAMLHERTCVEALATADLALAPARWSRAELGRVVLELVKFVEATCQERMGLLLAFISMAATDPAYANRRAQLEKDIVFRFRRWLESREGEISHPDLETAATVSVRMIFGALEYGTLLHRHGPGARDPAVAPELCRAVLAYLGAKPQRRAETAN